MTTECPVCDRQFDATGSAREHAWDAHGACHRCGTEFDEEATLHAHWLAAHGDELSRVERERARSDVGELTFRDRLALGDPVGAFTATTVGRRAVLAGGGLAVAGVGAAWATGAFESEREGGAQLATAPVPPSPGDHRYAVTGTGDADVTVTYYGSWKCPYCAKFSGGFLPTLVGDYVRSGRVAIEFRDLAYVDGRPFLGSDAPAAGHAGLAVWNTDPGTYWRYHEYVFRNQPAEGKRWATADRLASFAKAAGVSDPAAVRRAVENEAYGDALRATSEAASAAGIDGTPTLVVDGTIVSPFAREKTRRAIERAVE